MELKSETMKYVYASLLLHAASQPASEENLSRVLEAAGVRPDPSEIKMLASLADRAALDRALRRAATVLRAGGRHSSRKKKRST